MTTIILIVSCVILTCVLAEKFSDKFGMPALILFMFVGMLFGSDGIMKIPFDNFRLAENVCSAALIFIMFYGGFNTKWRAAKEVAVQSVVLSTLGVVATALITMLLCWKILGFTMAESFLIGSVLSSTDAASVFAILRKYKLNLKDGTASILEVESGSNDPISYMLTLVAMNMILVGEAGNVLLTIVLQIVLGIGIGALLAWVCIFIMTKTRLISDGIDTIFVIAMVLCCYGVTSLLGGNAYLAVYLFGILTGNSVIKNKHTLIPFFDGVTSLAQILIFFLIGLLTFPHQMPTIIPTALAIVVFLTIIARPIAVFLLMIPFKSSFQQKLLISWAGLRGASSSVFAIMAVAGGISMKQDLFHIVFMVSLFSVSIQGTLLPFVAKKLHMIDDEADVRKTFNDYQEESSLHLMEVHVTEGHHWINKKIKDVNIPAGSLALMIKRGTETIVPKGDTRILENDTLIMSVPKYVPEDADMLEEKRIGRKDPWCNKCISDLHLAENELIVMIIRGAETIIPNGTTVMKANDLVVTMNR